MTKYILPILILLFLYNETLANDIKGIVKDINGNPVVAVQIGVLGKTIKTYSNSDGFWMLNGSIVGDTITFSHLKYKILRVAVGSSQVINVTLENTPIELQPITISASKANYIIRSALKRISANYITDVYEQYGQIREKLYWGDSLKYLADTEAMLTSSYTDKRNDRITFKNVRTYLPEKELPLYLINGPSTTYLLDEVKSKAKIFNDKNIRQLDFRIKETVEKEGKKYYVIQFVPTNNRDIHYSGEIYVESELLAISYIKINAEKLANEGSASLELYYQENNGKYWMKSCFVQKSESLRIAGQKARYRGEVLAVMEEPQLNFQTQDKVDLNSGLLISPVTSSKNIWKGNVLALDSILIQEMKPLRLAIDTALHTKIEMRKRNQTELLYSPNLTIQQSNQPYQNLFAFNETYNSLNRLALYKLGGIKNSELLAGCQLLFNMYISIPFQGAEAERRILSKNGIKAIYNPTPFNRYFTSFCSKVSSEGLNDLKISNFSDYLRLHTVRAECNYASIKEIEETLFLKDLKNNYQRQEFSKYYFIDIYVRRLMMMVPTLLSGISRTIPSEVKESSQPLFANRMASYVHSLLNPSASLNRNISAKELNSKEQNQLSKMRWLSIQNIISPLAIAIPPFKIGNQIRFTYSLGYLPCILGDNFSQNLWIKTNSSAYRLTFNEYKSNSTIGYGIGFKIIDTDFLNHGNVSTEVNYWKQPSNMSYYPDFYLDGFAISQQLKYRMGKTALLLGYRFKTKGYLELSENTGADFSINFGLNHSF